MRPPRESRRSSPRWVTAPEARNGASSSPRCPRYARPTDRPISTPGHPCWAADGVFLARSAFVFGGVVLGRALQRLGGPVEQAGDVPAARAGDGVVHLDGQFAVMPRPPSAGSRPAITRLPTRSRRVSDVPPPKVP